MLVTKQALNERSLQKTPPICASNHGLVWQMIWQKLILCADYAALII